MRELYTAPVFTVGDLSLHIRHLLEDSFSYVCVRGEVGTCTVASSGHVYFSLKDSASKIDCVCFKMQAVQLSVVPSVGMVVVAYGRITTYDQRSTYQLIVDQVTMDGAGASYAQLEALKKRLLAEGLFDEARKRLLPSFPKSIGLITSSSGAVLHDMLHRLEERYPLPVLLMPTPVQGLHAAPLIVRALNAFQHMPDPPDILILARGGGSTEDLSVFNEEMVVRAVAGSLIPIISAIGHETDVTLTDFAADKRAPTPTAAIELCTPHREHLFQTLDSLHDQLTHTYRHYLESCTALLERDAMLLRKPTSFVDAHGLTLDSLGASLSYAYERFMERESQRLDHLLALLHSLNPRAVLAKGYTFVTDGDGHGVFSAQALDDTTHTLHFHDGNISIRKV